MVVLISAQTYANLFVVHVLQVVLGVRPRVLKVAQRHVLKIVVVSVFPHVIFSVMMDVIMNVLLRVVGDAILVAQERAKTLQMLLLHIPRYLVQIALLYVILVARLNVPAHVVKTVKTPLLLTVIARRR